MKKYFEYAGLIALTCFSFYYTEKVTKIMNSKDPIMVSIEEYKEKVSSDCKEGYITSDGVVLGVSGRVVDVSESYSKMQGYGYDENLMVFNEVECKVNLETTKDNYIIKGNDSKNSVSLFININDGSLIEKILQISNQKNIKLNLIVTGSVLETHKTFLTEAYKDGHELIYGGFEENDLKKYIKIMKEIDSKSNKYCINLGIKDNLNICEKEKINSLKTEKIYTKDILLNTKNNLEKGTFFVYKENNITLKELSSTINFIEGKQLKITNITELLS
jgi:hypothetical protein